MMFLEFKLARIFLLFVGLFLYGEISFAANPSSVCFSSHCFHTEVAQTASEKQIGLMGREHLAEDEGMIFVYEHDRKQSFWMKDMQIPLDFIWFDIHGKVVATREHVPACDENCPSIISPHPSRYVLEIAAGMIEKYDIKPGDVAVIYLGVESEN